MVSTLKKISSCQALLAAGLSGNHPEGLTPEWLVQAVNRGMIYTLTCFIGDGDLAAGNNRIDNLIRPIALGRRPRRSLAACARARAQRPS